MLAALCVLIAALAVSLLAAWRTGTAAAPVLAWLFPFAGLLLVLLHFLVLRPLHARLTEARRQAIHARGARDPITGLSDRHQVAAAWTRELARADRVGGTLGVGVLQIDGGLGEDERDALLWEFGYLLGLALRAGDGAFRLDDREVLLMLPGMPAPVLRRRLAQIARAATPRSAGIQGKLAISFGVALYPRDGARGEDLLTAARRAVREPPVRPVPFAAFARPGD